MGSRQKRQYADLSVPRTRWDLRVELPEDGMRLDAFLAKRVKWKSRTELLGLIDSEYVTVEGRLRRKGVKLRTGNRVVIQIPEPTNEPDPRDVPIEILHEDEQLLVVNKQPGIVVHPVGRHQLHNLLSALHARYRNLAEPEKDRVPHVCHRIDKNTSGVFLVAFDEKLKANVSMQFERREVEKEYVALVHGIPDPREGEIDGPILYRENAHPRLTVHEDGLPSRTDYRVEEAFASTSLIRFFPRTGRTHQIRIHSTWRGHPLLCDYDYGREEEIWDGSLSTTRPQNAPEDARPLLARCALHAASLTIRHPATGEIVTYRAPLPDDVRRTADALRTHAERPRPR